MNRLIETLKTPFLAARYSFGFCWRNSRLDTSARSIFALLGTGHSYLAIIVTGLIVSTVQHSIGKYKTSSFMEFATGEMFVPLVSLVGILLFGVINNRLSWFFRNRWNQTLRFANQREINEHCATLDVARFRSKEFDDISKRIQELPSGFQTRIMFSEEVISLFVRLTSFILFGTSLLISSPAYTLVLMLSALPMAIMEFRLVVKWWDLSQGLVPHHKKRFVLQRSYNNTTAFVQALMFRQMPSLKKAIDMNVEGVVSAHEEIRKKVVRSELMTHVIGITGLLGVTLHAIWQICKYGGDIGTLTVLMASAKMFQGDVESLVGLVAENWNSAKGVILIEKDLFGLKPSLTTEDPVVPNFSCPPCLRLEKVSFAYPDTDTLVLKDVSFTIQPGSKVAIVGKSGSGKSSLASLLMRHFDPSSGDVYAEDINLRRISPEKWTDVASSLTQDYIVLERQIGEEIASSKLDRPMDLEDVASSCRFADFQEVVDSDPEGFGSQIGTQFGGRDFSGGERQRLALARVHYRGTPILILDEPDAKLDPESAQNVIDRVFALKGVTVIIITHHVSRAERCDKIIMMSKGEVAEQGSHKELITQNGLYAKMFHQDQKRLSHWEEE